MKLLFDTVARVRRLAAYSPENQQRFVIYRAVTVNQKIPKGSRDLSIRRVLT